MMDDLDTRVKVLNIIIHELGHSLSLKHHDDTVASIMAKTKITSYGNPTTLDYANLAWKY